MKSQLVLLLVLLLIACTKAPKKIFTTNGANRFTAQQIETKRLALQAQLTQQIRTDFLVKASIVDSFSSGDSLIKKIRFEVMNLEIEGPKSRAALTKQVGQSFNFFHLTEAKAFIDSIELSAYPTTLLLDSEGVIKHVQGGLPYRFDKNGELGMGDGQVLIALLEEIE